ncbi:MAG TPA: hypothetical protein VFP81_11985 [Propionibacteriaceae bacterium]|nr:hypothetical protein [Propionibacteriaceae bacterium]
MTLVDEPELQCLGSQRRTAHRATLLDRGVPQARIRYEVFGPDLWAAQTAPDSGA